MGSLRERLISNRGCSELGLSHIESVGGRRASCCCCCCCPYRRAGETAAGWRRSLERVASRAYSMGKSDPRKIVFSAKMGLALTLVSLLIFWKEPFNSNDLSRYYVWALLTVIVVFEFSIGATLSKGLNRGIGTLSAGGLALGMAELSQMAGEWEEPVIILSIFLIGSIATYAKLYPTMKPYEYGIRVFLLTYSLVMVSGYRTREFIHTAVARFFLIALGAGVGLAVNVCIFPIWAGEDLHKLVVKNFKGVATSLEGCVNGYLNCIEYERVPSKILTYQASDDPLYNGYRAAVESTSKEDALLGFAIWEPPHGPYRAFRYPWKNYVKVSGALRHCAFTVMALHGCILSEIQAPAERRQVFRNELQRVGNAGAKVLRELGNKVKKMEKLGPVDILFEVHEAAEELQNKVDRKSYLLVNSESWEIGNRAKESAEPQDLLNFDDDENRVLQYKSLSEAVLDLRPFSAPRSLDSAKPNTGLKPPVPVFIPADGVMTKQISWTAGISLTTDPVVEESKTYESASALSLATFTSLLIEFVARLQNLVDAFEELSEKANFREPVEPSAVAEPVGIFGRLRRFIKC
ncbi:aluminum-activated malate transporter 9 [Syzygium oleosum]|uniref:aluminum-activated malate transporter 9 n=1 Tax=Syzygium oleosum TaxID=219896 RepID=UPI0011D25256|nr:aluminum-activated malate transporter 9 [Syzygium oleosum]